MVKSIRGIAFLASLLCVSICQAETVTYRLGLSLGGRGMAAGTGVYSENHTVYNGKDAVQMKMTLTTNKLADIAFKMRDTITSVQTLRGEPIQYCKIVNEKNTHNIETAEFMRSGGKHNVRLLVRNQERVIYDRSESWDEPVYDMLSMLRYARGIDATNLSEGDVVKIPMVNGELVVVQHIVFEGRERIKDERGDKTDCLRLSVRDYKKGPERETMKVYVTDDSAHIPVRLDIILGSAVIKAVLNDYTE